jgi:hypothetical protein
MTPPSPLQLCELSDKKVAIEYERFKQAKRELCANPSWIERQRIKLNVWLVARKLAKSDGYRHTHATSRSYDSRTNKPAEPAK